MHRRLALAFSLAFTTVVTFGVVAVGAQVGLFGGGHPQASAQVAASAPPPPTATAVPPTPIVVTQYDYVDVPDATPTYAPPTVPPPTSTAQLNSASPAVSSPTTAPAYQGEHEGSASSGSEEHDD